MYGVKWKCQKIDSYVLSSDKYFKVLDLFYSLGCGHTVKIVSDATLCKQCKSIPPKSSRKKPSHSMVGGFLDKNNIPSVVTHHRLNPFQQFIIEMSCVTLIPVFNRAKVHLDINAACLYARRRPVAGRSPQFPVTPLLGSASTQEYSM